MKPSIDICILTDSRYVAPNANTDYIRNLLKEDSLVQTTLEKRGMNIHRINWDSREMNWSDTSYILFRTTWDYYYRYQEFDLWLEHVKEKTELINPYPLVRWNLDKHYLADLSKKGINIPPTRFIEAGERSSLEEIATESAWGEIILKPVVSGGGRHTYRFLPSESGLYESVYRSLIPNESLIIQEFQEQVVTRGEVAFMLFDGKFSHAVLKRAKKGDFRVQDDFGGTVHPFTPNSEQIEWAESVVASCHPLPIYARVDAIWDNKNNLALAELELIEPELWFRNHPEATEKLADAVVAHCS